MWLTSSQVKSGKIVSSTQQHLAHIPQKSSHCVPSKYTTSCNVKFPSKSQYSDGVPNSLANKQTYQQHAQASPNESRTKQRSYLITFLHMSSEEEDDQPIPHRPYTGLTHATPTHQYETSPSQVIRSQNFTQSSCPREESYPRRNLSLPNALPREAANTHRTKFLVVRFYLKAFIQQQLPTHLILLITVNVD